MITTTTIWNTTGRDDAQEHAEQTGTRVLFVSDGVIGAWRELTPADTVTQALIEFRKGYEGGTPELEHEVISGMYTDYARVERAEALGLMRAGDRVFHDDLGGGSEAISAYRLPDGDYLVDCTGTGCWRVPAGMDAESMCRAAAHQCYVDAGFDSPYAD